MGKYFVTIFILLYLWAGAPKSNNIFTSLIMYEFFFECLSNANIRMSSSSIYWTSRFLHLLFHITRYSRLCQDTKECQ